MAVNCQPLCVDYIALLKPQAILFGVYLRAQIYSKLNRLTFVGQINVVYNPPDISRDTSFVTSSYNS